MGELAGGTEVLGSPTFLCRGADGEGGAERAACRKAMLAQVQPQGTTSPGTVSWPLHWQLLTHILPLGGGQ